jgi:signal transduction histidine kinase
MSTERRGVLSRLSGREASEYERLNAELHARFEEVRASRARLVEDEADARRRIERTLHDGAQQRLTALALDLRMARSRVKDDPEKAEEMIARAEQELGKAIEDLREIARGIHPAVLSDRGLRPALESLAGKADLPVELAEVPDERMPDPVERAAYDVVAEAVTNAGRHSNATHCVVKVVRENGHALVEVKDDGVGGADPAHGNGLRVLADRLSAHDGVLELVSAPGEGTIVYAEIPCA